MIAADEAIVRLIEGNRRYLADVLPAQGIPQHTHCSQPVQEQRPFAIVLGCSDSRVPIETIFDQGSGHLFIIRVAGNVVSPAVLGSIEFSVLEHNCKLIVVLGHTHCGAVKATIHAHRNPDEHRSSNVQTLVDMISPGLKKLSIGTAGVSDTQIMSLAVRANVHASAQLLQSNSTVLDTLVKSHELRICGAEYSLETGEVVFLDGPCRQGKSP